MSICGLGTLWIWEVPFVVQSITLREGRMHVYAVFHAEAQLMFAWPDQVPLRLVGPDGIEIAKGLAGTDDLGLERIALEAGDSLACDYHLDVVHLYPSGGS